MSEEPAVTMYKIAATIQLRRWTIVGIGALLASAITSMLAVVGLRPELAGFITEFAQPVVNGLIGLGGITVGFLFGRSNE